MLVRGGCMAIGYDVLPIEYTAFIKSADCEFLATGPLCQGHVGRQQEQQTGDLHGGGGVESSRLAREAGTERMMRE